MLERSQRCGIQRGLLQPPIVDVLGLLPPHAVTIALIAHAQAIERSEIRFSMSNASRIN